MVDLDSLHPLSQGVSSVRSVLLPPSCCGCGCRGVAFCDDCRRSLRPAPLLEAPPGVDLALALLSYEGFAADAVRAAKFRNRRDALRELSDALGGFVAARLDGVSFDRSSGAAVVTWVPSLESHRRRRGFDQGRLIAGRVAASLGWQRRALLRRTDHHAQLGLDRATRLSGPRVVVTGGVPRTVLVVDDVRTTGASLRVAASALRGAGAEFVIAATVAATPHPEPLIGV